MLNIYKNIPPGPWALTISPLILVGMLNITLLGLLGKLQYLYQVFDVLKTCMGASKQKKLELKPVSGIVIGLCVKLARMMASLSFRMNYNIECKSNQQNPITLLYLLINLS